MARDPIVEEPAAASIIRSNQDRSGDGIVDRAIEAVDGLAEASMQSRCFQLIEPRAPKSVPLVFAEMAGTFSSGGDFRRHDKTV
ncbi:MULTISPECIES: hypothetical protein [Mesorhizobium]|uniref:Uncharacterized protein n=3 Tax=Mesorhizobium TaxID=68287 RepID=A0AB38TL12_9HYPH|nr:MULTISPECIES: hypothetical protein [Mesorhizobium]AMX97936.1 hypothetical protein A4R28_32665 [Mesorhizobium ciceri]MBZ9887247.1 hypothetical protein [Mesorhizobium sp. BR1-1-3]MDF3155958.1 hypothetical protein [Mesorhizobium sp. XAP10]MDF3217320.1 hypothetical protein [Mesorhizobium ciceri]MDF3233778.1 hypothetical protein [Mesorhizobium sp. DSM 30133]